MPRPHIHNAIARIEVKDGDTVTRRGTGCLVAPNLVLTALHVVADRGSNPVQFFPGRVEIRFPDATPVTATVLEDKWDPREDWVLLTCAHPLAALVRPVPLATLDRDGDDWTAHGYPDVQPSGLTVHGTVTSSHAEVFGGGIPAYQLYCREAAAGRGLQAKGLSGAPVVVRDAVVGIIRWAPLDHDRVEAGTLFACPVSLIAVRCPKYFLLPLKAVSSPDVQRQTFIGAVFPQHRPEAVARVVVKTVAHAAVFLDGNPAGSAGADGQFMTTVPLSEPRQSQLRVTLPGRLPFEHRLTLTPGCDTTIDAPLQVPQPVGRLELFSTPQAEVLLNGELAGKADTEGRIELHGLEAGPLRLEVRRPGYLAAVRTITVDATAATIVNLELEEVAHPSQSPQRPPDFSPTRNLVGHRSDVRTMAFSPDSRWLVSAAGDDTVRLWEIATGRQRRMWSFGSYVTRVQFSPDGRLLAVAPGSGGAVHLIDSTSGETIRTLSPVWWNGYYSEFPYFAFSRDSRQIAMAVRSDPHVWIADVATVADVATGELTQKLDACCSLLAMPEGGWVVMPFGSYGENNPIRLFDRAARPTGTIALRSRAEYEAAALTADGRWLASVSCGGGHVQIWDTMTGREGYRLDPDEGEEFHRLVFSPDGRWLITKSGTLIANDGSLPYDQRARSFVKVWDTGTGWVVRHYAPPSYAVSLAHSPDGDWLALGLHEGSIALWGRKP